MARKLRVEYEGAIYHVMNRGDGGEVVFKDDEDRHGFVRALGEACGKTGWQVHAYCLMSTEGQVGWVIPSSARRRHDMFDLEREIEDRLRRVTVLTAVLRPLGHQRVLGVH